MLRAGQAAGARPARLLVALWRAFGGPFVRLGGLKLCNDALNFAGGCSRRDMVLAAAGSCLCHGAPTSAGENISEWL